MSCHWLTRRSSKHRLNINSTAKWLREIIDTVHPMVASYWFLHSRESVRYTIWNVSAQRENVCILDRWCVKMEIHANGMSARFGFNSISFRFIQCAALRFDCVWPANHLNGCSCSLFIRISTTNEWISQTLEMLIGETFHSFGFHFFSTFLCW